MANPIKYNTGSETQALNSGNWWIGTGDVGKGPTSTTGYYNGISPPSGGYTIYMNKATGGPVIYQCQDDSELIDITNKISGNSYSTANECLSYFSGQLDKVCFNRDYEGIVTDGLAIILDAGFTPSYPKNGTTWYDLSGNGNDGTLTNGPTFDTGDGGSIEFDGTNDEVTYPSTNSADHSVEVWFNANDLIGTQALIGEGAYYRLYLVGSTSLYWWNRAGTGGSITSISYSSTFSTAQWYHAVGVTESGSERKLFLNGIEVASESTAINFGTGSTNGSIANGFPNASLFFHGKIAGAKKYNRALSASEVLQNFNAQKGRFGL